MSIEENGRFEVGGKVSDGPDTYPEPYLLVKGICLYENYDGVVEQKHFEEKYGLPCFSLEAWPGYKLTARGIEIQLNGVSDGDVCIESKWPY